MLSSTLVYKLRNVAVDALVTLGVREAWAIGVVTAGVAGAADREEGADTRGEGSDTLVLRPLAAPFVAVGADGLLEASISWALSLSVLVDVDLVDIINLTLLDDSTRINCCGFV